MSAPEPPDRGTLESWYRLASNGAPLPEGATDEEALATVEQALGQEVRRRLQAGEGGPLMKGILFFLIAPVPERRMAALSCALLLLQAGVEAAGEIEAARARLHAASDPGTVTDREMN